MKVFILVVVLVVGCAAFPQGGGGGGGEDGGHGKATSYINWERKDGKSEPIHFKAHPEYHYGWKIADDKHHVYTNKDEHRDGYKVKGTYSLLEADGKTIRVVDYTADKKEGFNAKVTYKKHN